MSTKFSLGLDFGTESGRAVLANIFNGEIVASAVHEYRHGVIEKILPIKEKVRLGQDWALQDPLDYLETIKKMVPHLLRQAKVKAEDVVGIGIDFTSCTILPTKSDGRPLCAIPSFRKNPHAWVKLWKHHSAQGEAEKINRIAQERKEPFLNRYGGKISSEWCFPKALEMLNHAPQIYDAADRIIEAQDWLGWQLTGVERRSACAAGYKALWSKKEGFPKATFFKALHPKMEHIVQEKIGTSFYPPGCKAGNLTDAWAAATGLNPGTPVAVSIIDAHAAVLGGGISEPNEMVLCLGTSTCHLLLSQQEKKVQGICGVVQDGIVPGFFGYEAGQPATGDMFAWVVKNWAPGGLSGEIKKSGNLYDALERRASTLFPGESGLLALDWWNGNRSVLVDSNLSGLILGCTLSTQPHEIYRAMVEATGMGTFRIVQAFEEKGIRIKKLYAVGGLAERSALLPQIYADITGREILVASGEQICALGAAILGAVAAGERAGIGSMREAIEKMGGKKRRVFKPDQKNHQLYLKLYEEYARLYDYFGQGKNEVMRKLREFKRRAAQSREARSNGKV